MSIEQLLEQALREYGLFGALIVFLILGPGFTYVRTKNARLRAESKALALVNEFAKYGQRRADALERQLKLTQVKLDEAEDTIVHLNARLATAQRQVEELKEYVTELRVTIENERTDNARLLAENERRESRIHTLEQALLNRASTSPTPLNS